jgi:hypothetical protein
VQQRRDNVEVEPPLQILAPLAYIFATRPAGWTNLMPGDSLLNAFRTAEPAFTELRRPGEARTTCSWTGPWPST